MDYLLIKKRHCLKKLFKYSIGFISAIFGLVIIYLLTEFCLSSITVDKEIHSTAEVAIFIKSNGVHTDIVVPVKNTQMDWSKEIKFAHTHANDTTMPFLGFGWGDKGFYLETPTWADLKFKTAFNAVFGLSSTAMHTTFYPNLIENKSCKKILISKNQYARLVDYIAGSLQKDSSGHAIRIKTTANYGNTDGFYEANGAYSLFQTCNSWANDGLKASGQKACLWTAFDKGIFRKYE